jgi:hypothetical protein
MLTDCMVSKAKRLALKWDQPCVVYRVVEPEETGQIAYCPLDGYYNDDFCGGFIPESCVLAVVDQDGCLI